VELLPAFFSQQAATQTRPIGLLRVISNPLLQSLRTVFNDALLLVRMVCAGHREFP